MSFFSFLKRNIENYSLVVNIGSGSISGGLIKFTKDAGVDLVSYQTETIPFQTKVSVFKYAELMKVSLGAFISKQKKKLAVDRIFYIFSSPWSVSQTKIIHIHEPKNIKITEEYLNKVIDEQEKQFKIEIASSGKIIERKIVQIKINGYLVNNAINKLARELEISVFFTVVPDYILKSIENTVSKTFHCKNIWCHSSLLAVLSNINNFFPQKKDYIYTHVSEEITDITIINNGIMKSSASIPFGYHEYIRELSLELKVSEELASSMIRMHNDKSNDELANLKLAVSMDAAAKKWLGMIFGILDGFKNKMYTPESIFLIANPELKLFLADKLTKHDFEVTALDNSKIKLSTANDDLIFKLSLFFLDNIYKI